MRLHRSLLLLSRSLGDDPTQRRIIARSVITLYRQRRRRLALFAPLLGLSPVQRCSPRLRLWGVVSLMAMGRLIPEASYAPLAVSLKRTHAYQHASLAVRCSIASPFSRGLNYQQLLQAWTACPPKRLVIFHHYDRLGFLPRSWLDQLLAFRQSGWQVVVSSSGLACLHQQELIEQGVLLAHRLNHGLCLGAYRDLALLLNLNCQVSRSLQSLVLCNDSTVPVLVPEVLVNQLAHWTHSYEQADQPVLAGMTDSAQRQAYHLQSYLLYSNKALLSHLAWLVFWQNFVPSGDKDQLIDSGEIGLSQALLNAGVRLEPAYPLIRLLMSESGVAEELLRFRIDHPQHVNLTLFAWQALLGHGFPLIKKQILFDQIETHGQPIALSTLLSWLPPARVDLIRGDLQRLFVGRFSR